MHIKRENVTSSFPLAKSIDLSLPISKIYVSGGAFR
jgi:hypothetical protein